MTRTAAAVAGLLFLVSCSRKAADVADASPEASALPPPVVSSSVPPPSRAPAPPGEAKRTVVADLTKEPDLLPHRDRLRDHFGDPTAGPFAVQRVGLAWGRAGVLVAKADESDPIILVTEGEKVVFAKERPAGGISPAPRAMTIVAHPAGGIAYVAFVPTINVVAMRIWADDANPFADMQLFTVDACDALSAAYSPGGGWLVVAAKKGESRAQWIRDDGSLAWGPEGKALGASWREAAPASLAFDSPKTAVVVQYATGAAGRDHVLAFRYDAGGAMLWSAPVDLGSVPRVADPKKRIELSAIVGGGSVRVALAGTGPGGAAQAMQIDSSGKATLVR